MAHVVDTSNILVASRRTLLALNRKYGFTWRKIACAYGVNVKYIHEMAKKGKRPTNPEILEKMGLHKRRASKPLTPFRLAWLEMAHKTREAFRAWKGHRK